MDCCECGNELDEQEIEEGWAYEGSEGWICAFCNSDELPAENYDGRYED